MTQSPDSLCIPAQPPPRSPSSQLQRAAPPTPAPDPCHQLLLTQLEPTGGGGDPEWMSAPAGEHSASQIFLGLQEVDCQRGGAAGQGLLLSI